MHAFSMSLFAIRIGTASCLGAFHKTVCSAFGSRSPTRLRKGASPRALLAQLFEGCDDQSRPWITPKSHVGGVPGDPRPWAMS